jgi:hypothetical protein
MDSRSHTTICINLIPIHPSLHAGTTKVYISREHVTMMMMMMMIVGATQARVRVSSD